MPVTFHHLGQEKNTIAQKEKERKKKKYDGLPGKDILFIHHAHDHDISRTNAAR